MVMIIETYYLTLEFSCYSFENVFVAPRPDVDEKVRCFREQLHELD